MPAADAVEFLSPEWFEILGAELSQLPRPESGRVIALGQVITGAPGHDRDVCYTVSLGGGQAGVVTAGSVESAEVVLVTNYSDALALAHGEVSSASLLAAGKVKIRGDARLLMGVEDLFAGVRTRLLDDREHDGDSDNCQ